LTRVDVSRTIMEPSRGPGDRGRVALLSWPDAQGASQEGQKMVAGGGVFRVRTGGDRVS